MNTRHWGIIGIVADYGFSALSSVCGHQITIDAFSPEKLFLYGITVVDFGLARAGIGQNKTDAINGILDLVKSFFTKPNTVSVSAPVDSLAVQ